MKIIKSILISLLLHGTVNCAFEDSLIDKLQKYIVVQENALENIKALAQTSKDHEKTPTVLSQGKPPLLFHYYPELQKKISHISLGDFPTHVEHLKKLSAKLGVSLNIKRDDLSGKQLKDGSRLFGGNKVRKLEFLLADAISHDIKSVISFGCAGSNFALATSVYAKLLGIDSIEMLFDQPKSPGVCRNLLLGKYFDAQMHEYQKVDLRNDYLCTYFINSKQKNNVFPYVIPGGGSNYLGTLGFVNAAFELKDQIDKGELVEPDYVYVALGSMGTAVGLELGFKAVGIKTKIIPVRVISQKHPGQMEETMINLFHETNSFLHSCDSTFPLYNFSKEECVINHDFFGKQYGLCTPEASEAIQLMKEHENILLDGTYSGKAFAALLADIKSGKIGKHENVLFWDTYCGLDFSDLTSKVNYKTLPSCFHYYFEEAQ